MKNLNKFLVTLSLNVLFLAAVALLYPEYTFSQAGFTSQTTVSPGNSVPLGQTLTFTSNISSGSSVSGSWFYFEIKDSTGTKVFDRSYSNQSFSSTTRTYTHSWLPTVAGTYHVEVGVYDTSWNTLHWRKDTIVYVATTPPPSTGNIRVCQVLRDSNNTILDVGVEPNTTYRLEWFNPSDEIRSINELDPATGIPPTTTFTSANPLNTRLASFPAGPGTNGNNARCITYTGFSMINPRNGWSATYYYRDVVVNGSTQWNIVLNDGFTTTASLSTLGPYSNLWFDNIPNNTLASNGNFDGHIGLGYMDYGDFRLQRDIVFVSTHNAPISTLTYNATTTPNPATIQVGQSTTVATNVTASAQVADSLVNIEIVNQNGQRVYQYFRDNQTLSPTATQYSFNWNTTTAGTYRVQVGVFGANWNGLKYWRETATITVNPVTATYGSVNVCKVIMNETNTGVTDGAMVNNTGFRVTWFDPTGPGFTFNSPTAIPAPVDFTLPLQLNTYLAGYPPGPTGGNNAECKLVSNIPLTNTSGGLPSGSVYYREETINTLNPGLWGAPKYNDGWTSVATIENAYEYDGKLYDGNAANDSDPRNGNSDGHIGMGLGLTTAPTVNRTLVLQNRLMTSLLPGCTSESTCSTTEIGELTSSAFGETFNPKSTLDGSAPTWVRITIKGHQRTGADVSAQVLVDERINTAAFEILPPSYATGNKTFKLTTIDGGGNEVEITNNSGTNAVKGCDGLTLSCITGSGTDQLQVNLGNLNPADTRVIYFRVGVKINDGNNIEVNNNPLTSVRYQYASPREYDISRATVDININEKSFFQIFLGNLYSQSVSTSVDALSVPLPSLQSFIKKLSALDFSNPIVFYTSNNRNTGSGSFSEFPIQREVNRYAISAEDYTYERFYNAYKNKITDVTVFPGVDDINANPETGTMYWLREGDLTLDGSGWTNKTITGKKLVVFVTGNLYIKTNFSVSTNGSSFLAFVTQGSIGIAPEVNRVEGIYISDKRIDTECEVSFNTDRLCQPNNKGSLSTGTLQLRGSFFAKEGFNLDRTGTPGITAGELFYARPDFLISGNQSLGKEVYSWKESLD